MRLLLYSIVLALVAGIGCTRSGGKIIPGERLGSIHLDMSRQNVHDEMGSPQHTDESQASMRRDAWTDAGDHIVVYYADDRVVQIEVTSPYYVTEQGLSTRSTIEQIRAQYPDLEATMMAHDMSAMYFDAVADGIAFGIRAPEEGGMANPEGDAITIYVHPRGQEVAPFVHHPHGEEHAH